MFNKENGKRAEEVYKSSVNVLKEIQEELNEVIEEENNKIKTDVHYEYASGEFLSDFHIEVVDGFKIAYLSFWFNYGASPSMEDFFFSWNDNQSHYQLKGNRSELIFDIVIVQKNENIIQIDVICQEEYFNWISGEKDRLWSSAEYQRQDYVNKK